MGQFGKSLASIKQGDVVALLAGCESPVALRRETDGNWRFIGQVWIEGIMEGEAWPKDMNMEDLETFVLV